MVAADGLQPPDFLLVGEGDAVHLIGPVLFEEAAQALDALPRRLDERNNEGHQVFLADSACLLGLPIFRLLIFHQGVGPENPLIACDCLGGGHAHILLIDPAGPPDALALFGVRHTCVAQALLRQGNLDMGKDGFISLRNVLRLHDDELLCREVAASGVVVSCNHCGAVVRGVFADENCGAGHLVNYLLKNYNI